MHTLGSVDLTQIDSDGESPEKVGRACKNWKKIDTVQLKELHKGIIKSGAWLDDMIICAAQYLLKIQHPHIGGFQSTLLAENLSMEPQASEFVQVLNVNNCHWLTVSNIGCTSSSIKVYDSLGGRLPRTTKKSDCRHPTVPKEEYHHNL